MNALLRLPPETVNGMDANELLPPHETGVRCDLCNGTGFTRLHSCPVGDSWNPATIPIAVWRCKGCELVLLHPVPTADQLPNEGEWWSEGRPRVRRRLWLKLLRQRLRRALLGTSDQMLIDATRRAKPSGRLLDVGCGVGGLLEIAARHYDCVGLEPSPVGAEQTRRRGLTVIEGTFEEADIPESSFDIVLMDSVIEHVRSPRAVLAKANQVLRPGGVVVLKTPKFGGPAYRMHGRAWNGFRHGYHTVLFTGKMLGACLEATGFEVLERPRRDRMLDDVLILWGKKVRDLAGTFTP